MKAEELRIGNWFSEDFHVDESKQTYAQITAEDILDLYDDPLDDFYQPIPITEEWLLRFGFYYQSSDKNYVVKSKQENNNSIKKIDGDWCYNNDYSDAACYFVTDIKYVHQLQNMYYVLNEEELTIK